MSVAAKGSVGAGVALLLLSLLVAVGHVYTGDNYCGAVLYDTNRHFACADPMRTRTVTTVVFAISGVALVGYGVTRHRRRAALPLILGLAFFGLLLGAANRLLQPISNPWCGSMVNPHHYYEAHLTARCDAALSPYRHQAVALVVASLVFGAATTWAALRVRRIARADPDGSTSRAAPMEP